MKKKTQYYIAKELVACDNETIEVTAVEFGYFAYKLSRKSNFDVRSLIGLKVQLITDKEIIKNLHQSNNFT